MKQLLFIFIFLLTVFTNQAVAQNSFPTFLEGTWKMENREVYEKWDLLEDGSLKGTSYRLADGEETVTEYLEIKKYGNQIIYTAIVPTQNEGKGIEFILHQPDSLTYSFENPEHNFPKKIIYQKRSDEEIHVSVTGDGEQGFSFTIRKITDGKSNILRIFFRDIAGVWIASPADSSFISRLEYNVDREQFLVPVWNTLASKTVKYLQNMEEKISFTTVTEHEIHTGISWVTGDTLFHRAEISGSGNIKSYSSAIIKISDNTLHYYAAYSESKNFPELQFDQALVYRKEQTGN